MSIFLRKRAKQSHKMASGKYIPSSLFAGAIAKLAREAGSSFTTKAQYLVTFSGFAAQEFQLVKILIIEDEKKIASLLRKGLEAQGFVVEVANNGDEGYALATSRPGNMMSRPQHPAQPARAKNPPAGNPPFRPQRTERETGGAEPGGG